MSPGLRRRIVPTLAEPTVDGLTLREWVDRYMADHDERHERDAVRDEAAIRAAVTATQHALEAALTASQHALEAALAAVQHEGTLHRENHEKEHMAHEKQHHAEQLALDKAEAAMAQRLAAMNEFRDQLRDQAMRFATKEALDTKITAIERESRLYGETLRARIDALEKGDQLSKGRGAGLASGWGYLVAGIGVIVLVVNFVFFIATR